MKKYRILYVDDESDNLFAFKAVFRRSYEIHTALNGNEALEMAENMHFDLVISDQRMPVMTGVELLGQLKERFPNTLRMVMTGYSDLQSIIDAINQGQIYHYISKPWKADELKLVLDKALETYDLRMKNRELEKANILAQFEILKNQINPHFLFNSMNILSSLILSQPERALKFTNHFAKLYRSVLQLREQLIISLEEELDFVNAYILLQKIRFEDALIIEIDLPENAMEMSLPPFSLQTVLENAIKHNIVASERPLKVSIQLEDDCLCIKNPLQLRKQVPDSTKTGLQNLLRRYALLGELEPTFGEEAGHFVARLPL
ncbi:MAG: histidine kinase, partial [Bacteroidota bacterium]